MSRTFQACLAKVGDQGHPPAAWLNEMLDAIIALPGDVFAVNDRQDIYTALRPVLAPWQGIIHRRAAMCEALRVLAGFESSWDWNCGADTTAGPETPEETETGAFQVSANSLDFDPSLPECVDRLAGAHTPLHFIFSMKNNHALAVEYCARLLRFSTAWDGPIKRGEVAAAVSRAAVAEFETFLTSQPSIS